MNKLNTLITLASVLLTGYVIKRANREIKKAVMTSEAGLEIINRQSNLIDRYSNLNDKKNERIKELEEEINTHAPHGRNYTNEQVVNIILENERYKKALEFYANKNNWVKEIEETMMIDGEPETVKTPPLVIEDSGYTARKALERDTQ